jgi:hypothetical protein
MFTENPERIFSLLKSPVRAFLFLVSLASFLVVLVNTFAFFAWHAPLTRTLILTAGMCQIWDMASRFSKRWKRVGETVDESKPFVLLLRSFRDDGKNLEPYHGFATEFRTLEEILADTMGQTLSFVKIRNRARLPDLGAVSIPVGSEDWKTTVRRLMDRAKYIFVFVGATAGLKWELEYLTKSCFLNRAVLFLPTSDKTGLDSAKRWKYLCDVVRDLQGDQNAYVSENLKVLEKGGNLGANMAATFSPGGRGKVYPFRMKGVQSNAEVYEKIVRQIFEDLGERVIEKRQKGFSVR